MSDEKPTSSSGHQATLSSKTLDILLKRKRLPLEVMLDAMDALVEAGQLNGAAAIAAAAAPYVHAKLKDVQLSTDPDAPATLDVRQLRGLSNADLSKLEAILLSATGVEKEVLSSGGS